MRYSWLAFLACAACADTSTPTSSANLASCGADSLQTMVGQSADVLATMRFRTQMRVIGPDTAVTMDYNPERINIRVDGRGLITAVDCG